MAELILSENTQLLALHLLFEYRKISTINPDFKPMWDYQLRFEMPMVISTM